MSATKKRPKVGELADLLKVSPATVSKVINGRPGVSDETRRRVESFLAEQGYSRSLVSTKTSQTIELVVEYVDNNGTFEFIKHASYWAAHHGIGITVSQTDSGRKRSESFRSIIDRNPLGVVVQMSSMSASVRSALRSRNIPVVIIDPVDTVAETDMCVSIDNWTGGFLAAQHLIDLGHQRIGIITGPKNNQSAAARYSGFTAAMRQAGIPLDPELVKQGDYLPQRGYEAACALLERAEQTRPTAIFTCNDLTAVNVYRAARERGIPLPERLSVVGFDNVYPAQYLVPSLTTVNQPFDLVVGKALDMIMAVRSDHGSSGVKNGGDENIEKHVIFPTRLVVRASTAPPHHI